MQLLPLTFYPSPQVILDLLGHTFSSDLPDLVANLDADRSFILPDLKSTQVSSFLGSLALCALWIRSLICITVFLRQTSSNSILSMRKDIESTLGVRPHSQSAAMMVKGGTTVRVRVGFQPTDELSHTSLILIRYVPLCSPFMNGHY